MTIEELLAATGLTANDLVPIYDAEAAQSVEPTQKITAAQFAAAVKVLADLQGKLTFDSTPTAGSTNPVTSAGIATAIQQSTAITETELGATGYTAQVTYNIKRAIKQNKRVTLQLSCVFNINIPTGTVIATIPEGYRPSANVYVPAILITDADAVLLTTVTVTSSGNITQGSTGYCRKVYVCADYAL